MAVRRIPRRLGPRRFSFIFKGLRLGKATFFAHETGRGDSSFADRAVSVRPLDQLSAGRGVHAVHCSLCRSHRAGAIAPFPQAQPNHRRASGIEFRARGMSHNASTVSWRVLGARNSRCECAAGRAFNTSSGGRRLLPCEVATAEQMAAAVRFIRNDLILFLVPEHGSWRI